ncbi:2-amino-4-hydroxy-6-hydroxymethyldihydropteridine diphosphokinase [Pyruvatibacter mobilis]|uniref:2-amino-4-hydroxy-6- hydroxymethyldihydropteridine diphosphokinase n=1 Tax=Pyruvatibacter mobilis TaxID=1712261 RepID=UPI003C7C8D8B
MIKSLSVEMDSSSQRPHAGMNLCWGQMKKIKDQTKSMSCQRIFIAYGGNLSGPAGTPRATFEAARLLLARRGICVVAGSQLYESDPWGGVRQPKFLNGVWEVRSPYAPQVLMDHLLNVEWVLGRRRRLRWGPRVLDLDLLSFGEVTGNWRETEGLPAVMLPHPRMHLRAFVLEPLADLAPAFRPWGSTGPTVGEALNGLALAERSATRCVRLSL